MVTEKEYETKKRCRGGKGKEITGQRWRETLGWNEICVWVWWKVCRRELKSIEKCKEIENRIKSKVKKINREVIGIEGLCTTGDRDRKTNLKRDKTAIAKESTVKNKITRVIGIEG